MKIFSFILCFNMSEGGPFAVGRKRKRDNEINISGFEKLGVFLALLSIAERIIIMIMYEG